MAKYLLKFVKWSVVGIIALALLAYGVMYLINWSDQQPSPAAQKMAALYSDRPAVAEQDNAFVTAMGFTAPQGQDPRQRGAERIAWFASLSGQPAGMPVVEPERPAFDPVATRSAVIQKVYADCGKVDAACAAVLAANVQGIAEWTEINGWLLARYQAMLAQPVWLETVPFEYNTPVPSYSVILDTQRMLLLRTWLLAQQGDAAGVRGLLDADIQFWRNVSASSGSVLTKTVASVALVRHFTWGNLALRLLPPEQATAAMPESWLQPLSSEERSLRRSLAGEWKGLDVMLHKLKDGEGAPVELESGGFDGRVERLVWFASRPFLQPQDSSNRYADYLTRLADTLDVPYAEFAHALTQAKHLENEANELAEPVHRPYNIVGDVLSAVAVPTFSGYAGRVYDVEGVRRAGLLAVQLRGRGIAGQDVAVHLADADLRNPYSEQPFTWSEAEKSLVFDGMVEGERGHYAMLY